jgi:hypothetical protein
MGTLHGNLCTFLIISRWILLRMRNVWNTFVEKIKAHISCSVTFFPPKIVYEIMSKNVAEQERSQMTMWRMRFACWISHVLKHMPAHVHPPIHPPPPHTHTHTHTKQCNTLCFSTATMVSWTHLNVMLYVHWLSCCYSLYWIRRLCVPFGQHWTPCSSSKW